MFSTEGVVPIKRYESVEDWHFNLERKSTGPRPQRLLMFSGSSNLCRQVFQICQTFVVDMHQFND